MAWWRRTGRSGARIVVVLLLALGVLGTDGSSASALTADCGYSQPILGAKLTQNGPSEWQQTGPDRWTVLCNWELGSGTAGAALTVTWACPDVIASEWKSKTRKHAVRQSDTEVVNREDGGFTSFAGFFEIQEKVFLLLDDRTLVTLVIHSNAGVYDDGFRAVAVNRAAANARQVSLPCAPSSSGSSGSSGSSPPPSASSGSSAVPPAPALPNRKLCDELRGLLGMSDEQIRAAGIADPDKVPLAYDGEALNRTVTDAVREWQDRTGNRVRIDRTAPFGGTPGALTWLFSEGGVIDDVSAHYVVGKEGDLKANLTMLSRARQDARLDPLLTPGDVYSLALDLTGGDARQAMLLAHNTLRSVGRDGDYGYTGVRQDLAWVARHLQPLRPGNEQAGSWYHLFGTAYYDMVAGDQAESSALTQVLVVTASGAMMLLPGGQVGTMAKVAAGIVRVAGAGIFTGNATVVATQSSAFANAAEQFYREHAGGRQPDPVKFCFNAWGAALGHHLRTLLETSGVPPAPSSGFSPPPPGLRQTFDPVRSTEGTRFVNLSGSPFSIEWVDGQDRMVLDQGADLGAAELYGAVPALFTAVPEGDSWGTLWVPAAGSTQTVTFEAVRPGATLHFNRIDLRDAKLAAYTVTAKAKGDRYSVTLDNQRLDPDVRAPDGSVVRPEVLSLRIPSESSSPFDAAAPAPSSSSAAPRRSGPPLALLLGSMGAVLLGAVVLTVAIRAGRRRAG